MIGVIDPTKENAEARALAEAIAARKRKARLLGGRRVKYSEDQERDDHGRWASGGGGDASSELTSAGTQAESLPSYEQPPPDKEVGSLREGDRIWVTNESTRQHEPAVVTSVKPDPSLGGGAGWTHVVAELSDGSTHAFSSQTGALAGLVRDHAEFADESKIVAPEYWDLSGTYNPGGSNYEADRWREALGEDDQHVLTYWESSFAHVDAIRSNSDDPVAQRFEQLVKDAPLTDEPIYRGVPQTANWEERIGRDFRITAPVSGSTDVRQAAAFGNMLMKVEDAPAHLLGNGMNEAVMLPGRYEVVSVESTRTSSDLNVIGLSGRTGEYEYPLVTVRWTGEANWTSGGGRPRLEPQKALPPPDADLRRFIANDTEFEWEGERE